MSSTFLLVFGILSLVATFVALVRVRHPAILSFPIMMTSWLTGEYPLFHLVWQALAVAALIVVGGLGETVGVVGAGLSLLSFLGLLLVHRTRLRAPESAGAALRDGLGPDYLERLEPHRRERLRDGIDPGLVRRPVHHDRNGIEIIHDIPYGDHPRRNLLDVYRPVDGDGPSPVVLQIHGGAWIVGHKLQQAQPLLHQLARSGYVAVSINYRLGPKARFPDQIIDVKQAIAWVRDNIAELGGDPDLVFLTGGSAGGHLASLAALTPNDPVFQPGFEQVDTSVAGCIPLYGPPDFRDRHGIRGRAASLEPFLARMVMPGRPCDHEELWEQVSPIARVRADAPPFFVIQGALDVLVWREEARAFVERLREVSRQPVVYWEVPGAQHAFDVLNSYRCAAAVDAIEQFVGWVTATARSQAPADPGIGS